MVDAKGHNFQLLTKVSQIFYFQTYTPLLKDLKSLSDTI
jgi:hypothetical protein